MSAAKTTTSRDLLKKHRLISDQVDEREVEIILDTLDTVLTAQVPGEVTEFGCYVGTTALFLQRRLIADRPVRTLHVYDSFEGLPAKTAADASPAGSAFRPGALKAGKADLIRSFRQAGLPRPQIHKAWFGDLTPADLPPAIAFAFLDGDYYQSILDSLRLIWPRLSPGSRVVIDDYASEALPGVAKAVNNWLKDHPAGFRTEASLAILSL